MSDARQRSTASECQEIRELLWPLDTARAYVEGEEEARAHLDACPACQAFFRRDAVIGRALRGDHLVQSAPRELRERVFDALARERAMAAERPPRARGWRAWPRRVGRRAAWTGAIATVIALGFFLLPGGDDGSAFAQDYLNRAVQQRRVDPADSAAISGFFLGEFGRSIEPLRVDGARIARAMICLIEGRRAALVEYTADGRTIAHYRIPLGAGGGRAILGIHTESAGGVRAVRWSDDRFEHALVSALPARELERLARSRFGAD